MIGNKDDTLGVELEPYDQEDAPFLNTSDIERDGSDQQTPAASPLAASRVKTASRWQLKTPSSIVLVAAIAKFFMIATGLMLMMPMYRLIEDSLCHTHLNDDSVGIIDEMKCKTDEVQSDLAWMLGWFGLVNSVFSMLFFTFLLQDFKVGMMSLIYMIRVCRRLSLRHYV